MNTRVDMAECMPHMDFSKTNVKKAKQVDHILLLSGEEGLKCFNSWTLTDTERNDPDHIWRKFDQQIEP